ncbi:hypothetical protein WR25_07942 [Diploscapter pachys]|uniref:Glycolipid transfer protein domain-containing protein n=1 Tax=Diploscapter pachys TaxID=2018661 RepID=A0A2A2KKI4_9BILA|nr:hypothetical protein WR25_07942 [Diploscapter pachys]
MSSEPVVRDENSTEEDGEVEEEKNQVVDGKSPAFDIHSVEKHFRESLQHPDDDVLLIQFIDAYSELNRFIGCLGRIFHFVSKDINEKTTALTTLNKEDPEKFNTVGHILRSSGGHHKAKGVFEIICLHRALEFIMDFMQAVADAENHDNISHICRTSYDRTLAKHHNWVIRKAVHVASLTLPTRVDLIVSIHGKYPEQGESFVRSTISTVVEQGDTVHRRIYSIMKQHLKE